MLTSIDELLVYSLQSTAEWRRRKAEEYSEDERNVAAADLLDRLAGEIKQLEGTELHNALAKGLGGDDGFFSEILCEMSRSVGFRSFPSSGAEFALG